MLLTISLPFSRTHLWLSKLMPLFSITVCYNHSCHRYWFRCSYWLRYVCWCYCFLWERDGAARRNPTGRSCAVGLTLHVPTSLYIDRTRRLEEQTNHFHKMWNVSELRILEKREYLLHCWHGWWSNRQTVVFRCKDLAAMSAVRVCSNETTPVHEATVNCYENDIVND